MSRVAKKPVVLPKGVDVQVSAEAITVKGPKGSLTLATPPGVLAKLEGGQVLLSGMNFFSVIRADSTSLVFSVRSFFISYKLLR